MKKLPAFTLLEILLGMAISGVVVSASYFCLFVVAKQAGDFKASSDKTMNVILLSTLIQKDIVAFPYMKKESEYEIEFSGESENKVNYRFGSNFVLRTQNKIPDTLDVTSTGLKMLFEKKEREERHSLADEITFEVYLSDSIASMHFGKEYAPDVLMTQGEQKN